VNFYELVFVFLEKCGHLDEWGEMAVFSSQRLHPLGVLDCAGIGELSLYLTGAP
jgi:hypothetical protein